MRSHRDVSRAFTLIEMLIATSLFAMLIAAAMYSYVGVSSWAERGGDSMDRREKALAMALFLRRSIATADPFYQKDRNRYSFDGEGERLSFVTCGPVTAGGRPAWIEISNEGRAIVVRAWEGAYLTRKPPKPSDAVVVRRLDGWSVAFSYFDGREWKERWRARLKAGRLPACVRFELHERPAEGAGDGWVWSWQVRPRLETRYR